MARNLIFNLKGAEYSAVPIKVDRAKLYGWTELKALDDNGKECRLLSMDETGTLIIPKGGLGLGLLSPEREWVERSSLKAVKPDGSEAEKIPSSYSSPIILGNTVDAETFLDHKISLVYQLDEAPKELLSAIGEDIYSFTYSYRDSFKGDSAFVLAAGGTLFMLVGQKTEFEMLGLAQAGVIDEDETEEDDEDSGELDFSMM
ncbi:MAG: hypothetical protein FWH35_00525 [Treponema sp.]|nr:hypothetical protein [Treponema sp.]